MKLSHRVLVTGGAGYIGSHTVDQLVQAGAQVWILDNFSTGHRRLVHPEAHLMEGDVRDSGLVHRLLIENNIDAVIHFAAFTSVAESMAKPELYYDNNFGGTLGLLEGLRGTAVKFFIFSSTAAVYADPGAKSVTEDSITSPVTPYGKSKLMSEQAIRDVAPQVGFDFMILRYFNVAGASASGKWGQIGDQHTVLVKRAALAAVGKIPHIEIFGTDYPNPDGTAIRDYIHVEDLAEIHLLALQSLIKGRGSNLINCGYGHGYSVREVINAMRSESGVNFPVIEAGRRPGDLPRVVARTSHLQKLLKWKPRHDDLQLICRSAFQWEKSSEGNKF